MRKELKLILIIFLMFLFSYKITYSEEKKFNYYHHKKKLIDNHSMTNQDGKVRFLNFGASSLDIMVLYYVNNLIYTHFLYKNL